VDIFGAPIIVPTNDQNGKFNIRVPGLERYYYVSVKAPAGFLITAGICNDDQPGFECDYANSITKPQSSSSVFAQSSSTQPKRKPKGSDGIRTGRSNACVYVDKYGEVEDFINFGVMRVGDVRAVDTKVALVLGFDKETGANYHSKNNLVEGRVLEGMLRRATKMEDEVDGDGVAKTRYLLGKRDRDAIGTVTAEVLASVSLDRRLAANGVTLDSVDPKDVIVSEEEADATELAVELEIKGHYSPPPELDFDYIVQSSINADTQQIRRGLRDYNSKCRVQTSKVNEEGLGLQDFGGITSTSGTNIIDFSSRDNVFSTACSSNLLVPEYFETSLKEIEAKKVEDVVFFKPKEITYYEEEYDPVFESWAVGPVAAIAGLIVLLAGFLLFRRALRPRRVDKYVDTRTTKDVDGDEQRRFGEDGGAVDDSSVDSAFYSDSEEEEETEKERKKRRKRKEKANDKGGRAKLSNEERKALRKSKRALMAEEKAENDHEEEEELPNLVSGRASRGRNNGRLGMSQTSSNTVDSEFYSDLGSDLDETDKERKKRRRRKEKQKEKLLKGLATTKSSDTIKEGSSAETPSKDAPNTTSRRRSSSMRKLSQVAPNTTSRSRSSSVRNLSRSASSAEPPMSRRRSSSARNLSRSTSAVKSSGTRQRPRRNKTKSSSNVLSMEDFAMDPSSTPSTRRRRNGGKLSASMGGEAGIRSGSFSSSDGAEKNRRRKGKRGGDKSSASSSIRNSSRAPSLDRSSRRGRSKQSGGDNAKSFEDAQIDAQIV